MDREEEALWEGVGAPVAVRAGEAEEELLALLLALTLGLVLGVREAMGVCVGVRVEVEEGEMEGEALGEGEMAPEVVREGVAEEQLLALPLTLALEVRLTVPDMEGECVPLGEEVGEGGALRVPLTLVRLLRGVWVARGDMLGAGEVEEAALGVKIAVALAREGEGEESALGEEMPVGVPKPALLLGDREAKALGVPKPALLLGKGEGEALGVPKPALLLGEGEMEIAGVGVEGAVALARMGEGEEIALGEATLLGVPRPALLLGDGEAETLGVPKPALLLGEGEMEVKGLAEIRAVALAKEGEGIALGEAEPVPLLEGELLLLPAGESVAEVLTLELAVAQ